MLNWKTSDSSITIKEGKVDIREVLEKKIQDDKEHMEKWARDGVKKYGREGEMKTLEQFNIEKIKEYYTNYNRNIIKNGIACPECGEELIDSSPDITLCSNPPQKNVLCQSCGFNGYRIA